MEYEEMLEEKGVEGISFFKADIDINKNKLLCDLTTDSLINTCHSFNGLRDEEYIVHLSNNNNQCGKVNSSIVYLCDNHYKELINKRSKFPISPNE